VVIVVVVVCCWSWSSVDGDEGADNVVVDVGSCCFDSESDFGSSLSLLLLLFDPFPRRMYQKQKPAWRGVPTIFVVAIVSFRVC